MALRLRRGVHEQHAPAVALGEHDTAFLAVLIAQHGECGQRGQAQSFGVAARQRGLQPEVAGGEQQVLNIRLMAEWPTERMAQLRRIGGHMVQARDEAQRGKCCER